MLYIGQLLFAMIPIIMGGICNMIFVKLPLLNNWRVPMDGGKVLADDKRLFGDNKTWKGFVGMIVLTALWMAVLGLAVRNIASLESFSIIPFWDFGPGFDWIWGTLCGLAYVVFELPNSYIKRRVDIKPGKNAKGVVGLFFLVLDQADSVLGVAIVMPVFAPNLSFLDCFFLFLTGTAVHYLINVLLYFVRLKKQLG